MNPATRQATALIKNAKQTKSTELHLSFLGLSELPDSLFSLDQLEELVLSGNVLESLPSEIAQLEHLRVLEISGNKLNTLPESICNLSNLTRLDVASNLLIKLPDNLGHLTHLNYVDAFSNQLSILPNSLMDCHQLHALRLGTNDLDKLPVNIGSLKNLKILDVSNNNLEELPVSIVMLTALDELHLNGNLLDIPFHHLSKWAYQTDKLLAYIAQAKKKKIADSSADQYAENLQQIYGQKLNEWVKMQQEIIHRHQWNEEASISIDLSDTNNLSMLIYPLSELSHQLSIIHFLSANWQHNTHQQSTKLIAMLERRKQSQTIGSSLTEPASKLPITSQDQKLSLLDISGGQSGADKSLRIHIKCSSALKQNMLAIYLSLCEALKNNGHTKKYSQEENKLILDATIEQIDAILFSAKDITKAKRRIAEGLVLLAHDVCFYNKV